MSPSHHRTLLLKRCSAPTIIPACQRIASNPPHAPASTSYSFIQPSSTPRPCQPASALLLPPLGSACPEPFISTKPGPITFPPSLLLPKTFSNKHVTYAHAQFVQADARKRRRRHKTQYLAHGKFPPYQAGATSFTFVLVCFTITVWSERGTFQAQTHPRCRSWILCR
jgi:hypothetical protein